MTDTPISEFQPLAVQQLAKMRLAFDGAFARPPHVREEYASVIQIRVGTEAFVVRTAEITGLAKFEKVVPLPSRIPELLGIMARRGYLIPVFDLATLLGVPQTGRRPAWLVLVPGETIIGLAFDGFEGQQTPEWLSKQQDSRQYVRELVRTETAVCAVLDIPGLAGAIWKQAGLTKPAKERQE